jgi:hypothetical protein
MVILLVDLMGTSQAVWLAEKMARYKVNMTDGKTVALMVELLAEMSDDFMAEL